MKPVTLPKRGKWIREWGIFDGVEHDRLVWATPKRTPRKQAPRRDEPYGPFLLKAIWTRQDEGFERSRFVGWQVTLEGWQWSIWRRLADARAEAVAVSRALDASIEQHALVVQAFVTMAEPCPPTPQEAIAS